MLLNILVTETLFSEAFALGLTAPIADYENFVLDFTGSRRKTIINVCLKKKKTHKSHPINLA